MTSTRYATRAAAQAACNANQYAAGHIDLVTRETYWLVFNGQTVDTAVAPTRSERVLYTATGKKSSSRIQCGKAFKKFPNDRKAFIAYAVSLGVRPATANCMYSHYRVGRYSVAA